MSPVPRTAGDTHVTQSFNQPVCAPQVIHDNHQYNPILAFPQATIQGSRPVNSGPLFSGPLYVLQNVQNVTRPSVPQSTSATNSSVGHYPADLTTQDPTGGLPLPTNLPPWAEPRPMAHPGWQALNGHTVFAMMDQRLTEMRQLLNLMYNHYHYWPKNPKRNK